MPDTYSIWRPDVHCDDCNVKGVNYKHWGPLTNGEPKNLCTKCMQYRSNNNGEKRPTENG